MKRILAPMVIFILLSVVAIVISSGYFKVQGENNRLETLAPMLQIDE